jgi:hypothetical protein
MLLIYKWKRIGAPDEMRSGGMNETASKHVKNLCTLLDDGSRGRPLGV